MNHSKHNIVILVTYRDINISYSSKPIDITIETKSPWHVMILATRVLRWLYPWVFARIIIIHIIPGNWQTNIWFLFCYMVVVFIFPVYFCLFRFHQADWPHHGCCFLQARRLVDRLRWNATLQWLPHSEIWLSKHEIWHKQLTAWKIPD